MSARRLILAAALAAATASPAAAQSVTLVAPAVGERAPGWSLTSALDYAFSWDSNVLFDNVGSDLVSEQQHVLKPRGILSFIGRRGDFTANYAGAFVQHVELTSLNSFDQRLTVGGRRDLSRRVSLFARHAAALAPTTELTELVGVPFERIGSRVQDTDAGVTFAISRLTDATLRYRFHWVDFDQRPGFTNLLMGGQSHAGALQVRRAVHPRLRLTGEFDMLHASVMDGDRFDLQNARGGLEYQLSEFVTVSGGAGVSRLSPGQTVEGRVGPAGQIAIVRATRAATLSASYSRSYVPSFGFGGTTDNEELATRILVPIARRLVLQTGVSWRRNEPLDTPDLRLRSLWYQASVGYLLNEWMRVEAFSLGTRQTIDRPDGQMNRYHFGLQVTAGTTARIR